ncbi:hypothetical protein PM025_17265 [Halorubrum ezzemoulense]|uniref:hypothetical protein n=1 Tax=Halorubrum ezzemoulense TaxID=337243 RepID=UPI00232F5D69|nr:hypothetical protein [Halorubrum ezzemoulense]MDB2265828.1 hypothetical protein [Halorubrum ezzemoulense]
MDEGKGERREADKAKTIRDMIVDGTLSKRRRGQGMRGDEQGPTTGGNDQRPEATEHHQHRRRRETTDHSKRRPNPTRLTDDRYTENADPTVDDGPPVDR